MGGALCRPTIRESITVAHLFSLLGQEQNNIIVTEEEDEADQLRITSNSLKKTQT